MPSIVGKRQDGKTYYYLVESARVGGTPRIVSQQNLGSAAEVMAKLSGASAGEPVRTQHKRFGDVAAVWSVRGAPVSKCVAMRSQAAPSSWVVTCRPRTVGC